MKKHAPAFIIALAGLWLGWTVLVDFFVVPTVFQKVEDFFTAGLLGIAVFSKLNNLELITASGLVGLTALIAKKGKSGVAAFVVSLVLFSIVMVYFAWLTPKIAAITDLWKKADALGVPGLEGIADLQQEHQFYHRLYISIDSVKLGGLLTLLSFGVFRGERWK